MNDCERCIHKNVCDLPALYRGDPRKLRENYIYKVGAVYGNVVENEKPIKFYVEEQEGK